MQGSVTTSMRWYRRKAMTPQMAPRRRNDARIHFSAAG
jgi:hypothetical protein